jgi:methylglutaconyl-CoA hydratase
MSEVVHLLIEGGIATITLNSAYNRNALSAQLRQELAAHVRTALADDAARIILLTHTGTVFCAGADLKESREGSAPATDFIELLDALWSSPKPVIGRLAGSARAGGIGLVAICDLVIAVRDATFAFAEVRLGVVPAVISVPLRHRLQPHALRRLFLTGETFTACQAVDAGLLTAAVPAEELDREVARFTSMLLRGAPGALAATRLLLNGRVPSIRAELDEMLTLSAEHFASEEGREGLRAFAEKRLPNWVRNDPNL